MHLTSAPRSLKERGVPAELAELVHRMLDKDSSQRPGAIEIRQIARGLALDMSAAYESIEVIGEPPRLPRAAKRRRTIAPPPTTADVVVVDPDALEFGVTEMVPTLKRPRWTPELGLAPPPESRSLRRPITPRGASDEVAGEIDRPKRR